jgi:hypothetical protein
MTLTHQEFIRRFALHILPKRFVKIRHYGFLSSTWKREKLKILQEKLQVKVLEKREKKPFSPKMSLLQNGQFAPNSGFRPTWSAGLVSWR